MSTLAYATSLVMVTVLIAGAALFTVHAVQADSLTESAAALAVALATALTALLFVRSNEA